MCTITCLCDKNIDLREISNKYILKIAVKLRESPLRVIMTSGGILFAINIAPFIRSQSKMILSERNSLLLNEDNVNVLSDHDGEWFWSSIVLMKKHDCPRKNWSRHNDCEWCAITNKLRTRGNPFNKSNVDGIKFEKSTTKLTEMTTKATTY